MSVIYLAHPRHGVKVALMDLEAEQDEENGWTRIAPPGSEDAPAVNMLARDLDGDTMTLEAPRRRGRPRTVKDD
jgi:hypothetical protein